MWYKILFLLLIIFPTALSAYVQAGYQGNYCHFAGIINEPGVNKQEEFAMIFEKEYFPNFQVIANAIAAVSIAPVEELNNPECPIYKYARELLNFYDQNKEKINTDKPYLVELFDLIREKTHKPFLEEL